MAKRSRFITIIYVQYLFTNFAIYNYVLFGLIFVGSLWPQPPLGAVKGGLGSSDSGSLMVGDLGGSGGYRPTWKASWLTCTTTIFPGIGMLNSNRNPWSLVKIIFFVRQVNYQSWINHFSLLTISIQPTAQYGNAVARLLYSVIFVYKPAAWHYMLFLC